jgi:hypothetical protein
MKRALSELLPLSGGDCTKARNELVIASEATVQSPGRTSSASVLGGKSAVCECVRVIAQHKLVVVSGGYRGEEEEEDSLSARFD